jgi:hypothetical protein
MIDNHETQAVLSHRRGACSLAATLIRISTYDGSVFARVYSSTVIL